MNQLELDRVVKKAATRLIPMLVVLYFLAILDRGAAGFAALRMNPELGLSSEAFGIGTGLFFVGYLSSEIPSNFLLLRFGARRWLARIICTWGLVAMATAIIEGPYGFFVMRFLLGVAEAGFFPGIVYYLTLWFPRSYRGRYNSLFMLAIPVSIAAAAPISSSILLMDGYLGVSGWRWMFILEGLPSVVAGVVAWFYLADGPQDARWLNDREKQVLTTVLMQERLDLERTRRLSAIEALRDPVMIVFGLAYGGINVSLVMAANWLPQIAKEFGATHLSTGVLVSLPFLLGAVVMLICGKKSDVTGKHALYTIVALLVCGGGWIAAALSRDPFAVAAALSVAIAGLYAAMGVFWTLPTSSLTREGAASGIALVSAMGHLASALSPAVVGRLRDQSGGFASSFAFVGATSLVSAILVGLAFALVRKQRRAVLVPGS